MHVFFGVDDIIAFPTAVCIASLLNTSTESEIFHFHFVGKIRESTFNKILSLNKSFRSFFLDSVEFDFLKLNVFHTNIYNKKIILKLFASELFPLLERVLWLDCDTLILKNIREVYEMNIDGKCFAAVDICPFKRKCYKHLYCNYWFNGGIQLYNLNLMRKMDLQKHLLAKAERFGKNSDESALSSVPLKMVLVLPEKYNVYATDPCTGSLVNVSDIVVLHFLNRLKPWKDDKNFFNAVYFKLYKGYMDIIESIHIPNPEKLPKKKRRRRKINKAGDSTKETTKKTTEENDN